MDIQYGTNGNTIYNVNGGEVIDLQEIKRIKEKQAIENFHQSIEELNDLGIESSLVMVKYKNKEYSCVDIKRNYEFNKVFRVELRDLIKEKKLSKNARCFIGTLQPFISFPTNSVLIDYENPTYEVLMDILEMSKPTLMNTLNELENIDIIKRIKINGQLIIYFNCFLFCAGYCVEEYTYQLFKDSGFNPEKI